MIFDKTSNLIVFTDLDGTLLDHETYSYHDANEALSLLRARKISLILASSKTAAEIIPLRREIGFSHCPAIVENGAGRLKADTDAIDNNDDYQKILQLLNGIPSALRACFIGFSDWTAEEISGKTGLSLAHAELAKQRQFSEPGIWTGTEQQWLEFCKRVNEEGLTIQKGGRFFSISFGNTKADQMNVITEHLSEKSQKTFSVALGDGENDIPMLENADMGIIIPNPSHPGITPLAGETSGAIIRAQHPGPKGWNEIIMKFFV